MRHLGKWLMALGLLAIAPAASDAALWGNSAQSQQAAKQKNQKTANEVAGALRSADLQGYDIGIEVKEGTAILTGEVTDPAQKDKATQVASRAKGVKRVDNQLIVSPPKVAAVRQAEKAQQEIQQVSNTAPPTNQEMAEGIAAALGKAGMSGFDLEVRFEDGHAVIGGAVANPAQRARITQVVSNLNGIETVDNKVTVSPHAARHQAGPVPYASQAAYGPGPMRAPIHPAAFQQEGEPMGGGMPMPPIPMGRSNAGQVYDSPNLPNYSWPTYAQYPNSAAISYPKEYSASAWPYIGPFYPYPQVPLGWRSAQLEWDDGRWNLNFRSRTEKWWWFLSPKNW
ncbi:MAG: BON domain-containing protein [Planctomycetes bacterium]|nr:BON domain-containing protein [Planctomycetota bacterium]